MDKFDSLRAFTQVVESGGFAAAARKMGLSRSQVNKLVINLEDQLGVQLLHRTTRQVTPTDAGSAFYGTCITILSDLADAEQAVMQQHSQPQGTLKVNAPLSFGIQHLAPALGEFLQQYPQVQVELVLSDRFIDPIEEGFDITLRISAPPAAARLVVQQVAPAQRVLCASPGYLATHSAIAHPQDLAHQSCLHYGHLPSRHTWHLTGPDGDHTVSVSGALCSNNGDVLRAIALQGVGIALLPSFLVHDDLRQNKLQVVLPGYAPSPLGIYVLYPVNRYLSAKIQRFSDFLVARFGDVAW
ncbi:MAG: LysR family transcriptional regulator [Elainellaceae cyanobacterium]